MKISRITSMLLLLHIAGTAYAESDTRSGSGIIKFKDPLVKEICVGNWDKDGDGELSMGEAAEIEDVGSAFLGSEIVSFDEFKYFINVSSLDLIETNEVYLREETKALIGTFSGCNYLKSIVLPEKLRKIGWGAFSGCKSLISIVIPAYVTEIGNCAFANCNSLTKVVSFIMDPMNIYPETFENNTIIKSFNGEIITLPKFTSATLYVPANTKSKYETTPSWNFFKSIVEGDGISSLIDVKGEYRFSGQNDVYNMEGMRIRSFSGATYNEVVESLSPGMYIINGIKVLIK